MGDVDPSDRGTNDAPKRCCPCSPSPTTSFHEGQGIYLPISPRPCLLCSRLELHGWLEVVRRKERFGRGDLGGVVGRGGVQQSGWTWCERCSLLVLTSCAARTRHPPIRFRVHQDTPSPLSQRNTHAHTRVFLFTACVCFHFAPLFRSATCLDRLRILQYTFMSSQCPFPKKI